MQALLQVEGRQAREACKALGFQRARDTLWLMQIGQVPPQALADYLLAVWARWDPEAMSIEPISSSTHALSIELADRTLLHTELSGALADVVIARLSMIATLDFTASEERKGRVRARVGKDEISFDLSIRPARGGLSAELQRPLLLSASFDDDEVGEVPRMIGEYTILGEMGRGGLGIVYRAEHRLLRKPAAIKLLTTSARAALSNAALLREARAAARTRHPGVVEIYDVVKLVDGRYALIMELIEGETLSARLARTGAMQQQDAIGVVRMIAEIMQAMHDAGIVHRDLKPENVFMLPDGRIKLLDFGAARTVNTDGGAAPDSTFGTPWYMAPEQALGHEVDRRSDVYSLGCILYELVTGSIPFNAGDPCVVLTMHMQSEVAVPKSPHGPLPEALEKLILRSLSKSPAARQQDMGELLREIDAIAVLLSRVGWRKWLTL